MLDTIREIRHIKGKPELCREAHEAARLCEFKYGTHEGMRIHIFKTVYDQYYADYLPEATTGGMYTESALFGSVVVPSTYESREQFYKNRGF